VSSKFCVDMMGAKYDPNCGWQCSALNLPGAQPTKVVINGAELPLTTFEFDAGQIRFKGTLPSPVPDALIFIALDKRLVTMDTAILASIITLVGTMVTAWVTYKVGFAGVMRVTDHSAEIEFVPDTSLGHLTPEDRPTLVDWSTRFIPIQGGPKQLHVKAICYKGARDVRGTDDRTLINGQTSEKGTIKLSEPCMTKKDTLLLLFYSYADGHPTTDFYLE
jgi:hypothetical protein